MGLRRITQETYAMATCAGNFNHRRFGGFSKSSNGKLATWSWAPSCVTIGIHVCPTDFSKPLIPNRLWRVGLLRFLTVTRDSS